MWGLDAYVSDSLKYLFKNNDYSEISFLLLAALEK